MYLGGDNQQKHMQKHKNMDMQVNVSNYATYINTSTHMHVHTHTLSLSHTHTHSVGFLTCVPALSLSLDLGVSIRSISSFPSGRWQHLSDCLCLSMLKQAKKMESSCSGFPCDRLCRCLWKSCWDAEDAVEWTMSPPGGERQP